DVHRGDDIMERGVAPVLRRQIGAPQRRVVAHVGMLAAGQPRIAQMAFEIPEMMMGIDDGQVVVDVAHAACSVLPGKMDTEDKPRYDKGSLAHNRADTWSKQAKLRIWE